MSDETENTINRRERRRRERIGGDVPVSDVKARNAAKARVRAAESRLEAGDAVAALEKLKEAQRLDPESARAWFLTAMIEFNAGSRPRACGSPNGRGRGCDLARCQPR